MALLTVAGDQGFTRDKLVGYLWPESAPEHARHALSQLIHLLRRDLDPALLLTGQARLKLDRTCLTADLWDFQESCARGRLKRAVEFYHGPFLDGFYLDGAPEFDQWADNERQRLALQAGEALETLAARASQRGHHRSAAGYLSRLASQEPLNVRIAANLLTELAASGNVARALELAKSYETRIRKEFGTEPDLSFVTLVKRLRNLAIRLAALAFLADISLGQLWDAVVAV